MVEENWLAKFHAAMSDIQFCGDDLRSLADSLSHIGLFELAGRLSSIADTMGSAREQASIAVGQNLTEQVKAASEMSGTLLKTALAGVKLGREG